MVVRVRARHIISHLQFNFLGEFMIKSTWICAYQRIFVWLCTDCVHTYDAVDIAYNVSYMITINGYRGPCDCCGDVTHNYYISTLDVYFPIGIYD